MRQLAQMMFKDGLICNYWVTIDNVVFIQETETSQPYELRG